MTDFEYKILTFIYRSRKPVSWASVMNAYLLDGKSIQANDVLLHLLKEELLVKTTPASNPPSCKIKLSDLGVINLIQEDEHRKKLISEEQSAQDKAAADAVRAAEDRAAERKKEHSFQIKLVFLSSFLSFLFGAIASNLDRLIPWIISLLH